MIRTITIIFSTLLFSLTATAHHSFPAQYDINQPIELSGTVTEVQWTNPHIFIMVDVVDEEANETVNWILELGGPNTLLRLGWKRDSLKPDDRLQVVGCLARNGCPLVNTTRIIMEATGKRMLAGSSRDSQ